MYKEATKLFDCNHRFLLIPNIICIVIGRLVCANEMFVNKSKIKTVVRKSIKNNPDS